MNDITEWSFVNVPADTQTLNGQPLPEIHDGVQAGAVVAAELVRSGQFASVFGADLIVSRIIPPGIVFAVSEPHFVGQMLARPEIGVDFIGIGTSAPGAKLEIEQVEREELEYVDDFEWADE